MKQLLFSIVCAVAALSFFAPDLQAQTPGGSGPGARRRAGGNPEQRVREIIAKYDKDGDHALNATELAAFFEALHQRVEDRRTQKAGNNTSGATGQRSAGSPQEHAAKAIEKFDKNGDGKLEAGELTAMLEAFRERLKSHRSEGPGHSVPPSATPTASA